MTCCFLTSPHIEQNLKLTFYNQDTSVASFSEVKVFEILIIESL